MISRVIWKASCMLLLVSIFVVPVRGQTQGVTCEDLNLRAGMTASLSCLVEGYEVSGLVFRWQSTEPDYLNFLSSLSVPAPIFSAPTEVQQPLPITYLLVVHTRDGVLLEEAYVRVVVQPTCLECAEDHLTAAVPLQVDCPLTLHMDERESTSIACHASEAKTGLDTSLRYTWSGGESIALYPVDSPTPTIVAPTVPYGQELIQVPLTLAITSGRTQQTSLHHITVVIHARTPYLTCPEEVTLAAGGSIVLACHGADPMNGFATYEWTGLWGASTEFLSAIGAAAPIFSAPWSDRDTTYHYVVRMLASERTARHLVRVHVRGQSSTKSHAYCESMTLQEMEQRALPCHLPEGVHLRWRGPEGPSAPHLTRDGLTAPDVQTDTSFEYVIEFCEENSGRCSGSMPWVITVLNKKPPAVTCPMLLETYAGEPDLLLSCAVSGGTSYEYSWTGPDVDRLSALDVLSPTFDVPSQVDNDRQYAFTLTVTDAVIGSSSTDIQIRVLKRGEVVLACSELDFYVYVGSPDLPLRPECLITGTVESTELYTFRWLSQRLPRDLERLSSTTGRYTVFDVPDTLAASYTYEYTYVVGARFSNPARTTVRVHVAAFPSEFDMSVSTVALRFGEQSIGSQVTLDPMTGTISTQVRGPNHAGRMIFVSDEDLDVEVSLSGGMLYHQENDSSVRVHPQWSASASCLAPAAEALRSDRAVISLRSDTGGCMVANFGGELDLRSSSPGRYAGTLEVFVQSGEIQESYLVPVFVTVVDPGRSVSTGPRGTFVGDAGQAGDAQVLRIDPVRMLLTSDHPYGTFTVSNPSLIAQEVLIRSVFGYTQADDQGKTTEVRVTEPTDAVDDLGEVLLLYPKVFTLSPGEVQQVHYALREDRPMLEKAYAAQIEFNSRPRRYIQTDLLPVPDDSSRVAQVSFRVQGVYLPPQGSSRISVTLISRSQGTLLLETSGGPFEGEMIATDSAGNELGRRPLLLLTRRIVQWPISLGLDDVLTLRFVTQHGSAPPPVTLRWE